MSDTRILDGTNLPPEEPRKPEDKPEPSSPHTVIIIFETSPRSLQFELVDKVSIGRRADVGDQPDIDIAPYGGFPAGVSRLHARLHRSGSSVLLEDLKSRNGTFLDGERLRAGDTVPVRNGQAISFGGLHGWIFFENNS
jgi:pSer/pThr/pTyr-binding forkhead associated (FHA) protein